MSTTPADVRCKSLHLHLGQETTDPLHEHQQSQAAEALYSAPSLQRGKVADLLVMAKVTMAFNCAGGSRSSILSTQCSQSRPASHLGSACAHPAASLASCLLSLRDGPSHVATSALQGSLADSSCLPAAFHHSLAHNCGAARHGRQGLLPYSTVCHLSQGVTAVQGGPQQC